MPAWTWQDGVHVRKKARTKGGSTCSTLEYAPSSVRAQPPPSDPRRVSRPQSWRTCGQKEGAARPRAALAHCAEPPPPPRGPPPAGQLRAAIGARPRVTLPTANEVSPRWAGPGPETRGRGRAGRPPRGDVRPELRRVALETAFPSLRVSGGRPLPFNFFSMGEGVRDRPRPLRRPPASLANL